MARHPSPASPGPPKQVRPPCGQGWSKAETKHDCFDRSTHRLRTGVSNVHSVPASRQSLQVISPFEEGARSSHFIRLSLHPCMSASGARSTCVCPLPASNLQTQDG